MKLLRLFVLLSTLLCAVVAPRPARAQAEVSFDFFYDSLAPYGDWIEVGDYGLCWTPNNVDPNWTPYSDGYFAYTDGGWTWVSYEDFGGIVYHYGRWIHLDNGQWCWMPAYEWAPSWVSWRHSPEYIGWAPLPPEARWRRDVGFSIWVDSAYDIGPGYYHFCRPRDFGAPVLRAVIIDPGQNVVIIRDTVNITNITYNSGFAGGPVVFVGGPSFDDLSLIVTRPIPALKLVRNANFDPVHWRDHRGPGGRLAFNAQTVGNQLIVAAPLVAPPRDLSVFTSRVKTVIAADKVNKGWGLVKNPQEQNQLREEFRRQSKGLTPDTAPAHAVAAADLKSVPSKADPHATPSGTAERHDKNGKGRSTESVATQPNDAPGNPLLKPFNGVAGSEQNRRSQNPPGTASTPNQKGVTSTDPGAGGNNHERTTEQAEEARRRQVEQQRELQMQQQQQFEQKQQAQQQQQKKPQSEQPRGVDNRRLEEAEREREHERQSQHPPQPQVQQQQHGNQPSPAGSSPQPGNKGHSKDSKDSKDKDKDKNNN